jgi:spore coat protein JB
MYHGRNGEIFMRLKKDYEEELFFRIWINLSVE